LQSDPWTVTFRSSPQPIVYRCLHLTETRPPGESLWVSNREAALVKTPPFGLYHQVPRASKRTYIRTAARQFCQWEQTLGIVAVDLLLLDSSGLNLGGFTHPTTNPSSAGYRSNQREYPVATTPASGPFLVHVGRGQLETSLERSRSSVVGRYARDLYQTRGQ
jgi:hypothetical protein